METIKVYCIIVTYNGMRWVDRCLGSLRASSVKVHPIIIDNCSIDETVNYIREKYPEAYLVTNSDNKGFGQANNQGVEYAYKHGATHFFLLNQDAWIYTDTIYKLVEVQDKYNIGIVSPIHLSGAGNLLDYNYFLYSVIADSNIEYVSDLILNNKKSYYPVSKINAAAWMLSRKTIELVGGFDPIFFHYGEDNNYCQRIAYHNAFIAFVPGAFIHHDRERKGNLAVFKKNAVLSMLLGEYGNVNKNIWMLDKIRLKMHFGYIKLGVVFVLQLRLRDFGSLFMSYIAFIKKFPQLKRNIKINRVTNHNWLELG